VGRFEGEGTVSGGGGGAEEREAGKRQGHGKGGGTAEEKEVCRVANLASGVQISSGLRGASWAQASLDLYELRSEGGGGTAEGARRASPGAGSPLSVSARACGSPRAGSECAGACIAQRPPCLRSLQL
jgi:hypothetical protein